MFRSLSIHSMRKRKHNSWLFLPLGLSADNKVVNSDGCTIGKISELSLPNNQTIGISNWITILESKDTVLAEMAIGYPDRIWDRFQENMFLHVPLLVTDQSVSMGKSTPFYIFTWYSHIVALFEKSCPWQFLHSCPVKRFIIVEGFDSVLVDPLDSRMNVEISWPSGECLEQFCQNIFLDSCMRTPQSRRRSDFTKFLNIRRRRFNFLISQYLLVIFLIDIPELIFQILQILLSNHTPLQ